MGNVFALDVAYVLKDVSNPDAKIINSLNYLGLSYDLIDNSQVLSTNFSNYKLILVGNEKIKNIPFGNYKSLIMDFKYYKGFATSQGFTTANKAYNLENVITGNLSGEFRPYIENGRKVYFLSKKKLSSSVTTRGNSTIYNGNYIIAKKDSPRSVLFGIVESEYWTNTSEELFRNSLQWVFRGEDMDGDGSFTDEDCNDNDAEINPSSLNVYKNCKNDAPIVGDINLIVANKSSIVKFSVNATDPEGDELYYVINDSRFSEPTEGNFTWNTTGYSIGNYEFLVTVTDGEFQVKKEVQIEIRNREPVCSDIPDIYWNEDQTAILDLNDYCSDPDGDYISYAVGNTSKNTEIVVESIIDGVVSFYSKADWFGKDWLIFLFGDFASRLFSNNITLDVLPVNDASEFKANISGISWNEDTNVTLNLSNYFSDIDSNLTYSVSGNSNIDVQITKDFVVLVPNKDWFGNESVVFSATDGEYNSVSNSILLKVMDVNEVPEFDNFICDNQLLEDVNYNCEIKASDKDLDNITYSIVSKDNLNCLMDGNILNYTSYKDYYGDASCTIRVFDGSDYSDYELNVSIENVNDGPFIESFSPVGSVRILKGGSQEFNISVADIDSNLTYEWFVGGELSSNLTTYNFNGTSEGNYILKVVIGDGSLEDSKEWNVFVGDTTKFTCSEVGGVFLKKEEICGGEMIDVLDGNNCCSVAGSPDFSDIDRCSELSSNVSLEIRSPNEGDGYNLDDIIRVRARASHDFNDSLDFGATAYFYDITDNKIISEEDEDVEIDENRNWALDFEFDVSAEDDIRLDDEFAIFLKLEEDDGLYCQEDYTKIKLERLKHDVIIKNLNVPSRGLSCGDNIDFKFNIENTGKKNEDVNIVIESTDLGIKKEMDEFKLEKKDEKRISSKKIGSLSIPEDIASGNYNIDFKVYYNNDEDFAIKTKTLDISECEGTREFKIKKPQKNLILNNNLESNRQETSSIRDKSLVNNQSEKGNNLLSILAVTLLVVFIFLLGSLLFYLFYRK